MKKYHKIWIAINFSFFHAFSFSSNCIHGHDIVAFVFSLQRTTLALSTAGASLHLCAFLMRHRFPWIVPTLSFFLIIYAPASGQLTWEHISIIARKDKDLPCDIPKEKKNILLFLTYRTRKVYRRSALMQISAARSFNNPLFTGDFSKNGKKGSGMTKYFHLGSAFKMEQESPGKVIYSVFIPQMGLAAFQGRILFRLNPVIPETDYCVCVWAN